MFNKRKHEAKWKEVAPGLWERKDTPKVLQLSESTAEVYREIIKNQPDSVKFVIESLLDL